MVYNNGFPVGYNQMNPQQFQQYGYQMPQVQPVNGSFQNGNNQTMTPPTIHAEIVQVDDEQAAANYPVGAGSSQMMIARDDSAIFIKTATPNGQAVMDVYVKRPPAPPAPVFDPAEYVRKEDVQAYVKQAVDEAVKEALK